METKIINPLLILLGIIVFILGVLIGNISNIENNITLLFIVLSLGTAIFLFGLINYTKLHTWLKITISTIAAPLILISIAWFLLSFFSH